MPRQILLPLNVQIHRGIFVRAFRPDTFAKFESNPLLIYMLRDCREEVAPLVLDAVTVGLVCRDFAILYLLS
jgi:hypothetical protein